MKSVAEPDARTSTTLLRSSKFLAVIRADASNVLSEARCTSEMLSAGRTPSRMCLAGIIFAIVAPTSRFPHPALSPPVFCVMSVPSEPRYAVTESTPPPNTGRVRCA